MTPSPNSQASYSVFETALGWCGIAWREPPSASATPLLAFFQLPGATAQLTESRIARASSGTRTDAPPPAIADVIAGVQKHLRGEIQNFQSLLIDLSGIGEFAARVYAAAQKIPPGETRTYGEIAKELGEPGAARAVGRALGSNPLPLIVPCHRVLAANGKLGGFSAPGGRATKLRMLEIEFAAAPLLRSQ